MNFFKNRHPASYRDPAGFVFEEDGVLYRQVNLNYKVHYDRLISSGLYHRLTQEGLLIKHEEVGKTKTTDSYKFLKPERLDLICPPDWWTYDMLKDAALLTLRIQQISLQHGMILKDAHPSNVQFIGSRPIFIDSLSFICWDEKQPWIAYRQFCESFLFPLTIGHYMGPDSVKMLRAWPGGIPIQFVNQLLPWRFRLNLHWNLHLGINSKRSNETSAFKQKRFFSAKQMNDLVESLLIATKKCRTKSVKSTWSGYEHEVAQRGGYANNKLLTATKWIEKLPNIQSIIDLGANSGQYSDILCHKDIRCIQIESDPVTCNLLYRKNQDKNYKYATTICLDVADLIHEKYKTEKTLLRSDLVMCVGILHHLLYRSNLHLIDAIKLLETLTKKYLLIEFIESNDALIQTFFNKELVTNRCITLQVFRSGILKYFKIEHEAVLNSSRSLFLCVKA